MAIWERKGNLASNEMNLGEVVASVLRQVPGRNLGDCFWSSAVFAAVNVTADFESSERALVT